MLKVRQAVLEDIPAIVALYDGIIERFQAQTGTAAWRKGVYPTEAHFRESIQAGTLYVGELEGQLAAGMIVTQGTDKSYGDAPWRVDALDEETAVIHTLGVSSDFSGLGVARQMVEGAVALARGRGRPCGWTCWRATSPPCGCMSGRASCTSRRKKYGMRAPGWPASCCTSTRCERARRGGGLRLAG